MILALSLQSLEASPLAVALRTSLAYPVLETLHILGLAAFFGSLLVVDLNLLGAIRRSDAASVAMHILPWSVAAFALAAMTGSVLFLARAGELASNPVFLTKMVLILLAGLNAVVLHLRGPLDMSRSVTRSDAAASLAIWIMVIVCGRWIAYV